MQESLADIAARKKELKKDHSNIVAHLKELRRDYHQDNDDLVERVSVQKVNQSVQ